MAQAPSDDRVAPSPPASPSSPPTRDLFFNCVCVRSFRIPKPIYSPLPYENSIRLLRIHPGKPNTALNLTTLEPVRLDGPLPAYEALSYVWGPQPGPHSVIVNDHVKDCVGTNLAEALERLRYRWTSRLIWVDALCINQQDDLEKAKQVGMMHQIYARAKRVLVWLGPDEREEAGTAFAMLCAMVNEKKGPKGKEAVYETEEKGAEIVQLERVPDLSDNRRWLALMGFFANIWFLRMWVLQEIVLAQEATFIWGPASIDWRIVGAAIDIINDKTNAYHIILECRNLQNASFMDLFHKRQRQGMLKLDHPFLHFLDVTRSLDVTNPNDKVYGLLGLPSKGVGENDVFIKPDYEIKDVAVLYTKVAWRLLSTEKDLKLLSYAVHSKEEGEEEEEEEILEEEELLKQSPMPSWVPDWNCKDIVTPFMGFLEPNCHKAGTSRPMETVPSDDSSHLHVKGVTINTVQNVGRKISFMQLHDSAPALQQLIAWCIASSTTSPLGLAKVLTGGKDRYQLIVPNRETSEEEYLADFIALLVNVIGVDLMAAWPDEAASLSDLASGMGNARAAQEALWRIMPFRKPFVTTDGRLGLGPGSMMEGDILVVLWGGQIPYVIREMEGGWWSFVGEAYVDGLMKGEVEELLGEGQVEERLFELR